LSQPKFPGAWVLVALMPFMGIASAHATAMPTETKPTRPVGEDELDRARADLIHRLGARLEYNRSLVGDFETLFVQGLCRKYYSELPEIYAHLNLSEVNNQSKLIQPNNYAIVVVGDSAEIEPALVQAGFKVRTPEASWLD
jgi:hypothetical protein